MRKRMALLSILLSFVYINLSSCAGPIESPGDQNNPPVPVNSIAITAPVQNSSTNVSNITVSGTVSLDGTSPIAQILLTVDGGTPGKVAPGTAWATNISLTNQGIHYLAAALILSNGTTNLSPVVAFEYDRTAPTMVFNSPSGGDVCPTVIPVSVKYTDGTSSKAGKVYIKLNSGSYILSHYYVDQAEKFYTNTFTATAGSNTIACYGIDNAGNYSATNSINVFVSNIPSITLLTPSALQMFDGWVLGGPTVHLSGTVSIGAPASISKVVIYDPSYLAVYTNAVLSGNTWWLDCPVPLNTETFMPFVIFAIGNNGTTNALNSDLFSFDTMPPVVSLLSHTNNQSVGEFVSLVGSFLEGMAGVKHVYVKIDAGSFQIASTFSGWSLGVQLTSIGAHTVSYYAEDNVGNCSATNSLTINRSAGIHSVNLTIPYIIETSALPVSGTSYIDVPATANSLTIYSSFTTNHWSVTPSQNWSASITVNTNIDQMYAMLITSDGKTNVSAFKEYRYLTSVIPLTFNTLYEPLLFQNEEVWYSFNAVAGTTYRVWWNDEYDGSGAYQGDTDVYAWGTDGTPYLNFEDSGYSYIKLIHATKTEKIYLRFRPYDNDFQYEGQIGLKVIPQ